MNGLIALSAVISEHLDFQMNQSVKYLYNPLILLSLLLSLTKTCPKILIENKICVYLGLGTFGFESDKHNEEEIGPGIDFENQDQTYAFQLLATLIIS